MRLEIPDQSLLSAVDLVRHYDSIRKRLMKVHNEIAPEPIVEEVSEPPAEEVVADIHALTSKIVMFPSRPVFDQFRALAIQCGMHEPSMAMVIYETRLFYGLDHIAIMSHRRTKDVVLPRHVAMYLCREMTTRSLPDIGRFFNKRDHTTVLYACGKIERLRLTDERVADEIDVLKLRIARGMA
jgi:hypothetical protein